MSYMSQFIGGVLISNSPPSSNFALVALCSEQVCLPVWCNAVALVPSFLPRHPPSGPTTISMH